MTQKISNMVKKLIHLITLMFKKISVYQKPSYIKQKTSYKPGLSMRNTCADKISIKCA